MDSKTKKIVLITSMALIVILTASLLYMANTSKDLELRSGRYFCRMDILNESNTKIFEWDIGISKNKTKKNIIENEFNSKTLEKFRNTTSDIIKGSFRKYCGCIMYVL